MLTSPYVLPGLDTPDITDVYQTEIIYDNVSRYFNSNTNNFNRRLKEDVTVRYWSMFIAMCKGLKSTAIGSFFSKDHSTVIHAVKRIISEIEYYDDSKSRFEDLDSIYVIEPKNINSKQLKNFIISWRKQQRQNKNRGILQQN